MLNKSLAAFALALLVALAGFAGSPPASAGIIVQGLSDDGDFFPPGPT